MVKDKIQKSALAIDIAIPSDKNIRKKLEKYQGLKGKGETKI